MTEEEGYRGCSAAILFQRPHPVWNHVSAPVRKRNALTVVNRKKDLAKNGQEYDENFENVLNWQKKEKRLSSISTTMTSYLTILFILLLKILVVYVCI